MNILFYFGFKNTFMNSWGPPWRSKTYNLNPANSRISRVVNAEDSTCRLRLLSNANVS